MTGLLLYDRLTLDAKADKVVKHDRGFLIASPRTARIGMQVYSGAEVDPNNAQGLRDRERVMIYRPAEEVFSGDTLASMAYQPITNDHPAEMVDAKNWKQYATGFTGGEVARDGDYIRLPTMIMDASQVEDIDSGKRQLSWGYKCRIEFGDGQTPEGVAYDGVQREIRGDHLAVVIAARAGPECQFRDAAQPPKPTTQEPTMSLRKVLLDGISIETTEQGEQAISRLQGLLRVADGKVESQGGQIAGLEAAHRVAIEAKDGEIAALKASAPTAATLDGLVTARIALVGSARRLLGDSFDHAGKSDADIRRAAVVARLGDAAVAGKSDEYVAACFDTLAAQAVQTQDASGGNQMLRDPIRDHLTGPLGAPLPVADGVDKAWREGVHALENAWKGAA